MRDPLTYRYPRTTIQAFGCDADTAYAVTRYRARSSKWVLGALFVAAWALWHIIGGTV